MYLFMVLALMLVFPVASIIAETANAAIGFVGVGSSFFPHWVLPAAIVGMVFYGLAGINHLTHKGRNFNENVAMTSDIFVACVMLSFIIHP